MRVFEEPSFDDSKIGERYENNEYRVGNNALVWKFPSTDLKREYAYAGNRNLGFKIFPNVSDEDMRWKPRHGDSLSTSTIIQNIFWLEGLAPRVLDVVKVKSSKRTYYAQVIELLNNSKPWTNQAIIRSNRVIEERGIKRDPFDKGPQHCFGDYFVDFSDYFFESKEEYEDYLVEKLIGLSNREIPYQPIPELDIKGVRNFDKRLKALKFDEIDFEGKTVLVYGCNMGFVCREADRRGAKKVIGLDRPNVVKEAYELAFYLGHHNIDFLGGNFNHHGENDRNVFEQIRELSGIDKFDIVTFLACLQMGWPSYMKEIVDETLIMEGHKGETKEKYIDMLKDIFPNTKYLGQVEDDGSRPIYRSMK